jgi:hypothetical protein
VLRFHSHVGFVYYQDISPVRDLFCLMKVHDSHVGLILHYCVQYLPVGFDMFMFSEYVVY